MDHSHHDHSMHMGHSSMAETADMGGDRCSMNMLFTWNTENLCIVFRSWHVRSNTGLVVSLLAVIGLVAGYEALRAGIARYEEAARRRDSEGIASSRMPPSAGLDGTVTESTPFFGAGRDPVERRYAGSKEAHIVKAALYAVQTFYAFMIMLIFMTYNGWVMVAVGIGAFVGYLLFGQKTAAAKETACH